MKAQKSKTMPKPKPSIQHQLQSIPYEGVILGKGNNIQLIKSILEKNTQLKINQNNSFNNYFFFKWVQSPIEVDFQAFNPK
jgi:hypothetical protein